jgi:multicomponent Na+:H+ antiporter subunit G
VAALVPWVADALVILGVFVMTLGVYGMIHMPDTYTRLHAAGKAVFLGVVPLLGASMLTGRPEIIFRVLLITVFLLLTTPVSSHVIARSAYLRGEKMRTPDAIDESGRSLGESRPE